MNKQDTKIPYGWESYNPTHTTQITDGSKCLTYQPGPMNSWVNPSWQPVIKEDFRGFALIDVFLSSMTFIRPITPPEGFEIE